MGCIEVKKVARLDARSVADLGAVGPIDRYKNDHKAGLCAVFAVVENGTRAGTVLMRIERKPSGDKEAVIVAAKGQGDLLNKTLRHLELLARHAQAKTIRCHTERPGLVVKLMKARDCEAVLSWGLG